jgi:hypothetical protein
MRVSPELIGRKPLWHLPVALLVLVLAVALGGVLPNSATNRAVATPGTAVTSSEEEQNKILAETKIELTSSLDAVVELPVVEILASEGATFSGDDSLAIKHSKSVVGVAKEQRAEEQRAASSLLKDREVQRRSYAWLENSGVNYRAKKGSRLAIVDGKGKIIALAPNDLFGDSGSYGDRPLVAEEGSR